MARLPVRSLSPVAPRFRRVLSRSERRLEPPASCLPTLYAAGLRLAEATHLRLPDIDSQRMQLKVNADKGGKDRYVPISPRLLEELRGYWNLERPTQYLFPGRSADVPLSSATVQTACKLAAARARIAKTVTPHRLRHSYTTGLLEAGGITTACPARSRVRYCGSGSAGRPR